MQFIIGIFCFIIFFYTLYLLGKDDYVLIRKNLSLEQLFDYAFVGVFSGLLFFAILSVIFHPVRERGFIIQLFSPLGPSFTLTSVIFGCILGFYLVAKYRKLPIGRLFDFFSLALLSALPAGYLLSIFFVKSTEIIYYVLPGVLYLIIMVFFWRFLLHWMVGNKLRDGTLSCLFLLIFSSISLTISLIYKLQNIFSFEPEFFISVGMFFGSFFFLIRNERRKIFGVKR